MPSMRSACAIAGASAGFDRSWSIGFPSPEPRKVAKASASAGTPEIHLDAYGPLPAPVDVAPLTFASRTTPLSLATREAESQSSLSSPNGDEPPEAVVWAAPPNSDLKASEAWRPLTYALTRASPDTFAWAALNWSSSDSAVPEPLRTRSIDASLSEATNQSPTTRVADGSRSPPSEASSFLISAFALSIESGFVSAAQAMSLEEAPTATRSTSGPSAGAMSSS